MPFRRIPIAWVNSEYMHLLITFRSADLAFPSVLLFTLRYYLLQSYDHTINDRTV